MNKLLLFLYLFHVSDCDWISEWMSPVQEQFEVNARRENGGDLWTADFDEVRMEPVDQDTPDTGPNLRKQSNSLFPSTSLKTKLESTLVSAENLVEILKTQITALATREQGLKTAIANGRSGVTAVTVSTIGQQPRTYLVREGVWALCNGMVQMPLSGKSQSSALFTELFSTPRCIGQEVSSLQDPCVFNSVIKYETIPTSRSVDYAEDDYLCLKNQFNMTLEQYLSVPKRVLYDTCKTGVVRSVPENLKRCGLRIMSEYTYYPHRSSTAALLPLEYCTEKDGSCKMIIAWHISNATIENFEFLKNEQNFKDYFIKSEHNIEQVM